ncbi:MAG: hypothetical protein M8353_00150 [ANME-2 cluster archaeon]|nr:hypothetical protein [ANME-2 cluster archaeon]
MSKDEVTRYGSNSRFDRGNSETISLHMFGLSGFFPKYPEQTQEHHRKSP